MKGVPGLRDKIGLGRRIEKCIWLLTFDVTFKPSVRIRDNFGIATQAIGEIGDLGLTPAIGKPVARSRMTPSSRTARFNRTSTFVVPPASTTWLAGGKPRYGKSGRARRSRMSARRPAAIAGISNRPFASVVTVAEPIVPPRSYPSGKPSARILSPATGFPASATTRPVTRPAGSSRKTLSTVLSGPSVRMICDPYFGESTRAQRISPGPKAGMTTAPSGPATEATVSASSRGRSMSSTAMATTCAPPSGAPSGPRSRKPAAAGLSMTRRIGSPGAGIAHGNRRDATRFPAA